MLTGRYIGPLPPVADFGHPNIHIILCIMQWDEKELDTQFTQNVYFWTPSSEILAKALSPNVAEQYNNLRLIDRFTNIYIQIHIWNLVIPQEVGYNKTLVITR